MPVLPPLAFTCRGVCLVFLHLGLLLEIHLFLMKDVFLINPLVYKIGNQRPRDLFFKLLVLLYQQSS